MPYSGTKDLFLLVKALSNSEKRLFKLYAQKRMFGQVPKGTAKDSITYIRLFDAIDKQQTYDERKILEEIKILKPSQLSNQKNYLYDLILHSLSRTASRNTTEGILLENILFIRILYEKSLLDSCLKRILRAKETAYKFELFRYVLILLKWEVNTRIELSYQGAMDEELSRTYEEERNVLETMERINKLIKIRANIFFINKKIGAPRSRQESEEYEKLMIPLTKYRKEDMKTFEESFLYYNCLADYYLETGKHAESKQYYEILIGLLWENLDKLDSEPLRFIGTLNNFCTVLRILKQGDLLLSCLEKIRSLPARMNPNDAAIYEPRIFISSYLHETDWYLECNRFEKCVELIPLIEGGLKKFASKIRHTRVIYIYYLASYIYFITGKFSKSLQWINRILNDPHEELREDLHTLARIMNLLIHYELGNSEVLEYITRSARRYLTKKQRLFRTEQIILEFVGKCLVDNSDHDALNRSWDELAESLKEVSEDTFEKKIFQSFDFIIWLESKREGFTMAEWIAKNSRKPDAL